ncbi:relaxase/mobilization nuclease domain-containing protein [Pedobacter psychrodurus]|uniref:relaxase/mobilization nuclease domain-containing protein n=1 Tax=Pedobacter psychrodurus TaxID=2530456 RepID=UPI00292FCE61|nr:relaxase/mobilization nuclease domain-containing protein [Pedobacter psychrodurus]
MIVKILSSSASFSGVNYNTDKVELGKGELVNVSNFGALGFLSSLRPSDYINYFKAVSSVNKRVSKPQFHAVISARGRSTLKEDLTRIAQNWLSKMGYGKNPYLLVFHNDTQNNHIHAVSTRIDKTGKKISSAFEKLRSIRMLSQVLEQDAKTDIKSVSVKMLKYRFSTVAQFRLLFEVMGFKTEKDEHVGQLKISGQNGQVHSIKLSEVDKQILLNKSTVKRVVQLREIINKYKLQYSPLPLDRNGSADNNPDPLFRYGSELGDFLSSRFGLQFIFHYSGGHFPYGYTIIDHADKNVFKGSEVMKITLLVGESKDGHVFNGKMAEDTNLDSRVSGIPSEAVTGCSNYDSSVLSLPDLAEDIDDEAILGRNRQRKGMARTNTR